MGSPVSVVIVELILQTLENEMFPNVPSQTLLWKRYIDDVIAMLSMDLIENHLHHISKLNLHSKFTVERENHVLPILSNSI